MWSFTRNGNGYSHPATTTYTAYSRPLATNSNSNPNIIYDDQGNRYHRDGALSMAATYWPATIGAGSVLVAVVLL
ncbi:Attachment protein G3P, N-terminal [Ceraceosorus bombacis]|uniref:Attachment protein G3P, N-terminal n=1 Tax=Ceraceosorus bombacis TaxID=401625 RepID=A0A0P1BKR1_9BASI|nr:Attachment protein G3P, N-terminal [Ceraceosorus bombacis]